MIIKDNGGYFEGVNGGMTLETLGIPVFGRGIDGNPNVSGTVPANINTSVLGTASGGRLVDAPATSITAIAVGNQSLTVGSISNFVAGDICLVVNLQGSPTNFGNVGNYEMVQISGTPSGTHY